MGKNDYCLITAARNEGNYIEKTIMSVINQSILPKKWIIISDGSTDNTDDLIKAYSEKYEWVIYKRLEDSSGRNFASKYYAIIEGYKLLSDVRFNFIGCLDGDIVLDDNYYKSVIERFNNNKNLGLAGGYIFEEAKGEFKNCSINRKYSVAGAIQLFKKVCWDKIGGYVPLKYGGSDALAAFKLQMYGFDVESFPELPVYHLRGRGMAQKPILAYFRGGIRDYTISYSFIFVLFKGLSRFYLKPYILSSVCYITGFVYARIMNISKIEEKDFNKFMKILQKNRILQILNIYEEQS